MPISNKASDLLKDGKLNYGDPCYQADWNSTIDECAKKGSLAELVFHHYGIAHQAAPTNAWTHCCPLDLINQDPFSCIKMSLEAMLLSGEYWEVYADEFGRARFIKILQGSSEAGPTIALKHIQYCLPTIQTQDLADMVIVKAAQPPPFRRCGHDWFTIVDRSMTMSTTTIRDLGGVFPMGNNPAQGAMPPRGESQFGPLSLQGMKFTWGHVNGHQSVSTDSTCDHGVFAQFGCVVYPDFQRKQSFRDEYVDVAEVEGYETILFWLIDVDYGSIGSEKLKHYNIQFTKSSEIPAHLQITGNQNDFSSAFGPICDLGQGTGTTPRTFMRLEMPDHSGATSCDSIESASQKGKEGKGKGTMYWDECSLPSFFGYGRAHSKLNFLDISKWSPGSNQCVDDQFADNMYEATTSLMANGCTLEGFKAAMKPGWSYDSIDIGWQKERRTFDLPQSSVWVELPYDQYPQGVHGNLHYVLRAKAPDSGTWCENWLSSTAKWVNPYHQLMLQLVGCRWQGSAMSNNAGSFSWPSPCGGRSLPFIDAMPWIATFKPPGYLMSMDEGLYTVDEIWAKVTIGRPGIIIKGMGAAAETLLNSLSLKALPVYQVDFPVPTAAAGGEFGTAGFKVNPDNDLFDNMYCTMEDKKTDSERLQEACTGNVLEFGFPFLYPHVKSGEKPRQAFDKVVDQCLGVARNLWGYINSYHDMPNKNMTFICGPPETQDEVPFLGQTVATDHGPRTINNISFSYSDASSFSMTVEVGPVSVSQASAGTITHKQIKTEDVRGRIVTHEYGALYKVNVPGIGVIKAWNIDHWPWNAGDRVQVQLYNNPKEV
jgi:hypothetical protein